MSLAGQGGGTEDIAITTAMVHGDVITIDASFTLPDPGTYSLTTKPTTLKVNGEYIIGAGYKNLKAPG